VDEHAAVVKRNVPAALREAIRFWHFGGAIDVGRLRFFHRLMFRMVMSLSKSPDAREHKRRGIDNVRRDDIRPLIDTVRSECR